MDKFSLRRKLETEKFHTPGGVDHDQSSHAGEGGGGGGGEEPRSRGKGSAGNKHSWGGGFSRAIADHPAFTKYATSAEAGTGTGWVGHRARTARKDKILESVFRSKGLSEDHLADFITTTYGRHFGDMVGSLKDSQEQEFREAANKAVRQYARKHSPVRSAYTLKVKEQSPTNWWKD